MFCHFTEDLSGTCYCQAPGRDFFNVSSFLLSPPFLSHNVLSAFHFVSPCRLASGIRSVNGYEIVGCAKTQKHLCAIYSHQMPTEETLPCFCCVTAAGMWTCVALCVVQQIRKHEQVTAVVIHFLSEVEFLRKLSRPHCGTGSDVSGQRTKPASHFTLFVFRKAQQPS